MHVDTRNLALLFTTQGSDILTASTGKEVSRYRKRHTLRHWSTRSQQQRNLAMKQLCSSCMVSTIILIYVISMTEYHFIEQTSAFVTKSSLQQLTSPTYNTTSLPVLTSSKPETSSRYQTAPTLGPSTSNSNKSQRTEMTSASILRPVLKTTPFSVITMPDIPMSMKVGNSCKEVAMDLVIMLDSSNNSRKHFVTSIVDKTGVDTGAVRIGLLKYQKYARILFHLNRFSSSSALKKKLSKVTFRDKSFTNTADGILTVTREMFQSENGDRPGVDNVLIIMTSRPSNRDTEKTIPAANDAKTATIRIITVGIQNYTEMASISSKPLKDNQFIVPNFDDSQDFVDTFAISLCKSQKTRLVPVEVKPRICRCPCKQIGDSSVVNMSMAELDEAISQLKALLTVNKTSLTLNIYKKKSAPDSRMSSLSIGIVGAVLLSVPFLLFLIFDFVNVYKFFTG